jgi:hypothetical protein
MTPFVMMTDDVRFQNAFTAEELGRLSTLQRPLPTVDKTPPRLA